MRAGREDFLLHDVRADILDLEQRRSVERPGGQGAFRHGAAAHDRLAIGKRCLDDAIDARDVGLVDHRPHVGGWVELVADADAFERLSHPGADLVGHPALDEYSRRGHAELAGECGDARGEERNCACEVGVVEDDHRRLPPSSRFMRFSVGAPLAATSRPTVVLPV